ncbi:MAG: WG repeat-containing protein [Bacteroidales bacterium]|nr:WG repeat-containing protein [Bacteroidales bacterium]
MKNWIFLLLFGCLASCGPVIKNKDYLLSFTDTTTDEYGYKNTDGEIIIPLGKYSNCFTDTFKTYAIVTKPSSGFLAIDRQENLLFEVFPFDNGPDEPSDGLFRIILNHKIGYADSASGKVVIPPQFDCAWPFENGVAAVSINCKTISEGEHSIWLSDDWLYIDKTGKKVEKPKTSSPI